MSTLKVDTLDTRTGSGNITISRPLSGLSGSGASLTALNASELTSGTIPIARIADGAITTAKIAAGNVSTATIADGAITAAKIADGTVVAAEIADGAITTAKIAAGNVSTATIADASINAAKLANGAVTNAKMADDAVGVAELSATGTASSSTFLRGDNAWATPAGGAWEYVSTSSSGTARSFRNIFSWSTYPCWMFVFNGIAMDNAGGGLGVQFYDASDTLSTSGYQWNYAVLHSNSSSWSVSNSNSDTFMHLSNNPSNGAPLWCNLLVWYRHTRNVVTADCVWDHTQGSNYFGRSVAGGRKGGFESTGIYFKQWAGVFQGGDIYAYRLKKT